MKFYSIEPVLLLASITALLQLAHLNDDLQTILVVLSILYVVIKLVRLFVKKGKHDDAD